MDSRMKDLKALRDLVDHAIAYVEATGTNPLNIRSVTTTGDDILGLGDDVLQVSPRREPSLYKLVDAFDDADKFAETFLLAYDKIYNKVSSESSSDVADRAAFEGACAIGRKAIE